MSKRAEVWTSPPDASARDAARCMKDHGIGSVVVVDGDHPVGIVTDRDLVTRVACLRVNPGKLAIREFMSEPLIMVDVDTPLRGIARVMKANGIRRLPVVNLEGRVVRLITADDLIDVISSDLSGLAEGIQKSFALEKDPPAQYESVFGKE